jgi:hypothetical protein
VLLPKRMQHMVLMKPDSYQALVKTAAPISPFFSFFSISQDHLPHASFQSVILPHSLSYGVIPLGHCMKVFETDPLTSSTKKVYSTIYLTVLTRRKAGWFVANIFVPTFLMLVVSWLTFIYEPHGTHVPTACDPVLWSCGHLSH